MKKPKKITDENEAIRLLFDRVWKVIENFMNNKAHDDLREYKSIENIFMALFKSLLATHLGTVNRMNGYSLDIKGSLDLISKDIENTLIQAEAAEKGQLMH